MLWTARRQQRISLETNRQTEAGQSSPLTQIPVLAAAAAPGSLAGSSEHCPAPVHTQARLVRLLPGLAGCHPARTVVAFGTGFLLEEQIPDSNGLRQFVPLHTRVKESLPQQDDPLVVLSRSAGTPSVWLSVLGLANPMPGP